MAAMTFDEFKQCVKIQGGLDFEALDVAFVEPLKDLHAWWQRQSDFTKAYVNFFTVGLGSAGLVAFIAKVVNTPVAALSLGFAEALGAITVGVGWGVLLDVIERCKIQAVEAALRTVAAPE